VEMLVLLALVALASCQSFSISSAKVDEPYIAMTFDDGPNSALTPKLLDILKARGVKCTFFILGSLASMHPNIVARIAAEGHEVADHTWDHTLITKLSQSGLDHQIVDTANVLRGITGKWPRLFRPPYGGTNPRLNRLIRAAYNMKVVIWNVDPDDWKRPGPNVVAERLISHASKGAIMLAHDIQPGTIEAMPQMFDTLLQKGYKFVTVSQLLDLAKLEDQVGNEHPGTAGDKLTDGGAKGTGKGGNQTWRSEEGGDAPRPPVAPVAPRVESVSCITDMASWKRVQEILIAKNLLTGPADGMFGPKSRAALQTWLTRNSLPGDPICITAPMFDALKASQ